MIRIAKETIIKTFREEDVLVEIIQQFHYDTEAERIEHRKVMEADGYQDSGQVKENIGTIMNPKYTWFGSYYKYKYSCKSDEEQ